MRSQRTAKARDMMLSWINKQYVWRKTRVTYLFIL
jgi:hypothetical protein